MDIRVQDQFRAAVPRKGLPRRGVSITQESLGIVCGT